MRITLLALTAPMILLHSCVNLPGDPPFGQVTAGDDTGDELIIDDACPISGMTVVPGFTSAVLGNDHCTNAPNTFRLWEFTDKPDFCMATFPFPGEGYVLNPQNESPDEAKLSYGDVVEIDAALREHGLRICDFTENLWAASGPDNLPFTYGHERIEYQCAVDGDADRGSVHGYGDPIGSDPECVSWAGIRDFGTRSLWGRIDDQAREAFNFMIRMEDNPLAETSCWWGHEFSELDPEMEFVISGAYSANLSTSGDNGGWHHHLYPEGAWYDQDQWPDGNEWADDHLRICADTGAYDADLDAAWQQVRDQFIKTQDYTVIFDM